MKVCAINQVNASVPKDESLPSYHHGDLHAALIESALRRVEQVPYEQISLHALATELGVSQAAPYRHFKNKDALLVEIAKHGFAGLIASRNGRAEAAPRQKKLEAACHGYVLFALQNPGLYRLMFQSSILAQVNKSPDLEEIARESFSGLIEQVKDDGRFADPLATALFIWSSLHGSIVIRLAAIDPTAAGNDADGKGIVDVLFQHIGKGTRAPL